MLGLGLGFRLILNAFTARFKRFLNAVKSEVAQGSIED